MLPDTHINLFENECTHSEHSYNKENYSGPNYSRPNYSEPYNRYTNNFMNQSKFSSH